ncbi:Ig-like domain-containing protein [Parabacteroides distasonis]|uniref:Ig-like domain-containing protein n=1 Tax=Parabacteroides distasonis TaxID=823 RepID=UPI001F1778BF|nr:Ig-like domain-containing protein [Parabacteroides distasonis]MCE9356133.1 Ig-like domain-containing protein [Parabacteroides distasonis]
MRKILSLFFVMALCVVGLSAQGLVQGQPHPSAPNVLAKTKFQLRADASFSFDDIQFWVGSGSKRAALVIEWHDGNRPDAMVWGYRWDGEATGHDMIVAIAKADPKLLLLTQYTGWMGYTIDGIGYGDNLDVRYDLDGAKNEPKNAFKFEPPITNPLLGQTGFPENPAGDVAAAIRQGVQTGVIYHPINAERYGYPSYDYDHWSCSNGIHWQAGWYYGYWSYFVRSSQTSNFSYSGLGATSRVLTDGCWDAWSWNGNMNTSEGTQPGDVFVAATIPSGGGGDEPEIPVIHVTSISLNKSSLRLQAGANAILAASISPVNADNKQVTWSSSDTGIATVEDGVVTGAKPGVVKITARSVDGGYTAVCEVTVTETVTPEIDFEGTGAVISFPKVEEATSYEVRVYRYENGSYKKIGTYVADAEGNIITELLTKGLRATSGTISVPLKNLGRDDAYRIEIQVMNGLDVIDTYMVEKSSDPVSNETMAPVIPKVSYQNGALRFEHLAGYQIYLMQINGKILERFVIQVREELHSISLPSGNYLLIGEKDGDKKIFKIHITQ